MRFSASEFTCGRVRHQVAARFAAVLFLTLACIVTTAAVPTARAADRAGRVPWQLAGPGWSIVEYSAAPLDGGTKAKTGFYLVTPQGRKYRFYLTPTATAYQTLALLDWSGDRRRILVYSDNTGGSSPTMMEQISLVTGTVVSRFRLPASVLPDAYTRPRGDSMLAVGLNKPGIYRYSLTGKLRQVLTRRQLGVLKTLDSRSGAFLLAGTPTQLLRISTTGAVTRRIRIPDSSFCGPARWWTATTALVDCYGKGPDNTERLWLVPAAGGAPRPLTPALPPLGHFQGYVGAWTVGTRLYLQAEDDLSNLSIVQQSRDGARQTITVPGPAGNSDAIITAHAGQLLLWSNIGPGGPSSLFWFNPMTRAVRFLFRAKQGTAGISGVVAYGYQNR
jgi:hypothetical protein